MNKIIVLQSFADIYATDDGDFVQLELETPVEVKMPYCDEAIPLLIVIGRTEEQIREADTLLQKKKEKCRWTPRYSKGFGLYFSTCKGDYMDNIAPDFCHSCGREVFA